MIKFLNDFYYIIPSHLKKSILRLQYFFLFSSLLEVIVVYSLGPVVGLFLTNNIHENEIIIKIFDFFSLDINNNNLNVIKLKFVIYFVIIFFISQISIYFSFKKIFRLAYKIADEISNKLYKNNLHQDLIYITGNNTNRIISILTEEVDRFIHNGVVFFIRINSKIFLLFLFSITFLYINFFLSFITLMLIFIYYLFFYIFIKKKLYKNGVIINLYSFKKIKLINETFTSFRDVSVYNLKNKLISNLEEVNKTLSFAKFENSTISIASKYILYFIFIFILLLFGLINLFFFEKSFNNSIVYLIILVFAGYKIIPNFQDIFHGVSSLQSIKYTTEILKEQILLRPDTQDISSVQPLNTKTTFEDLVFKNVSFSYRERKNIFYDYNLTIKSGDRICIEGESGSGKSTLIDLLLGLAKCSSGEIILNGLNLNNKNIIQYHKIIGYVPQKIFLFDQSILENITLNSTSDYNSKQLDFALRMACLQDFIKDLPKGLNTKVGEIGSQISGGQAQRISIARAVYKDPQIYIFDEPTSSLNKEISEIIISNFMRLNNKTIIISSHKTEEFKKYGYRIVKINN